MHAGDADTVGCDQVSIRTWSILCSRSNLAGEDFVVVVTTISLASFRDMRDNLQIGERYELLKQLGSGSFSEVCLAEDRSTGEKVSSAKLVQHCHQHLPYYSAKFKKSLSSLVHAQPAHGHLQTTNKSCFTGCCQTDTRRTEQSRASQACASGDMHTAQAHSPLHHWPQECLCTTICYRLASILAAG